MRVIEVHVPSLSSFILWLDKLPKELGGLLNPWALELSTFHSDDIWFHAYIVGYSLAILHLDYDESEEKCKITISTRSKYTEQKIVDYWESFDWQMIDLQPPKSPPHHSRKLQIRPRINWSTPISCPHCYAVYRYQQSIVDKGSIECQNCGKTFEY